MMLLYNNDEGETALVEGEEDDDQVADVTAPLMTKSGEEIARGGVGVLAHAGTQW